MYRRFLLCCLFAPLLPVLAQGRNLEEVRDTLRFIRLAETKKNLSFDEEKLVAVNDLLDTFEEKQFELRQKERRLRFVSQKSDLTDSEAEEVLAAFVQLRKDMLANDLDLWTKIRGILSPRESVEFFTFYEHFQREIQRRIRTLQGEDGPVMKRNKRRGQRN